MFIVRSDFFSVILLCSQISAFNVMTTMLYCYKYCIITDSNDGQKYLNRTEVVINRNYPFILLCGNAANGCVNYIHPTAQCYNSQDKAYICLFHCFHLTKICFVLFLSVNPLLFNIFLIVLPHQDFCILPNSNQKCSFCLFFCVM